MLTQKITLTLDGERPYTPLIMRQGDSARSVEATIIDSSGHAADLTGMSAKFQARKPDGTIVARDDAYISGNVVTHNIAKNTLAVAGNVDCEFVFTGTNGVIGTVRWTVRVEPAAVSTMDILSSDDLQIIGDSVERASESAKNASESAKKAEDSAAAAAKSENSVKESAEDAAKSAQEAQRIKETMRPEIDVQPTRVGVKFPDELDYQYTGELNATVTIGEVKDLDNSQASYVKNVGTDQRAVLEIGLREGRPGASGDGTGDMVAKIYDPQGKRQDIFNYDGYIRNTGTAEKPAMKGDLDGNAATATKAAQTAGKLIIDGVSFNGEKDVSVSTGGEFEEGGQLAHANFPANAASTTSWQKIAEINMDPTGYRDADITGELSTIIPSVYTADRMVQSYVRLHIRVTAEGVYSSGALAVTAGTDLSDSSTLTDLVAIVEQVDAPVKVTLWASVKINYAGLKFRVFTDTGLWSGTEDSQKMHTSKFFCPSASQAVTKLPSGNKIEPIYMGLAQTNLFFNASADMKTQLAAQVNNSNGSFFASASLSSLLTGGVHVGALTYGTWAKYSATSVLFAFSIGNANSEPAAILGQANYNPTTGTFISSSLADKRYVALTSDQTIGGNKTFSNPVAVAPPTDAKHAIPQSYADSSGYKYGTNTVPTGLSVKWDGVNQTPAAVGSSYLSAACEISPPMIHFRISISNAPKPSGINIDRIQFTMTPKFKVGEKSNLTGYPCTAIIAVDNIVVGGQACYMETLNFNTSSNTISGTILFDRSTIDTFYNASSGRLLRAVISFVVIHPSASRVIDYT